MAIVVDNGFGANQDLAVATASAGQYRVRSITAPSKGKKTVRSISLTAFDGSQKQIVGLIPLVVVRTSSKWDDAFAAVIRTLAGGSESWSGMVSAFRALVNSPSGPYHFTFADGELTCSDGESLHVIVGCPWANATGTIVDAAIVLSVTGYDSSDVVNATLR